VAISSPGAGTLKHGESFGCRAAEDCRWAGVAAPAQPPLLPVVGRLERRCSLDEVPPVLRSRYGPYRVGMNDRSTACRNPMVTDRWQFAK